MAEQRPGEVAASWRAVGGTAAGANSGDGGSGGGGGSDFCSTAASVSSCTISPGAGTQPIAGSSAGDAQVTLSYSVVPTSKDQCKNGGWRTFTNPTFKNQGDCVSYVTTGRK